MSTNVEKINLFFFKTIELREDGFSFKGDFHKFDDIMHLDFYWKKTQVSYNFAKMPTYDTAILSVEKDNEKIVKIKLEGSEEQCNKIFYIYSLLSEKTFVKRYNLYINEMDKMVILYMMGNIFSQMGKCYPLRRKNTTSKITLLESLLSLLCLSQKINLSSL